MDVVGADGYVAQRTYTAVDVGYKVRMLNASSPSPSAVRLLRLRTGGRRAADRAHDLPEILLRELQHRTANVLHFASMQLELQARRRADVDSKAALVQMAASFGQLIEAQKLFVIQNLDASADAATEIRETSTALALGYAAAWPGVRFDCVVDVNARFSVRPAGVLALIVNELMTNAFKHAFSGRDSGFLVVSLTVTERGKARLSVIDDGPGFDPSTARAGTGMAIVESLAKAIGGAVSVSGGGRPGCAVSVTFPSEPTPAR